MTRRRSHFQEDTRFRVLRLLEENPDMSQRELAAALGVSTGGVHYLLSALVKRGLIKMGNFSASTDKRRYAYILTPRGLVEKAAITGRFLARKREEYEVLRREISQLEAELSGGAASEVQDLEGEGLRVLSPSLLKRKEIEKPWGRMNVPSRFATNSDDPIGEIWFEHEGEPLELLIKYLFTSEKLSIQVHPSDELAAASGLPSGKEECWLVLDAEPGAKLGIGTREILSAEELRAAALDGSLEDLVDWKPVSRGDFYYIPAGTVHAIGAGVTLIEVQQNADITYRLYDYGRPRELHLEKGIEAAAAAPYPVRLGKKVDLNSAQQLVAGPKFDLWLGNGWPSQGLNGGMAHVIPLTGAVTVDEVTAEDGECLLCSPDRELHVARDTQLLIAQASCADRDLND